MKSITTVELFAGIGGFRLACDEFGLRTVWANDIDKQSASVYCDNFGKSDFHIGDIRELKHTIPNHDVLTAGFPCQPFSKAGQKKGVEDCRGTLFEEIIHVLKNKMPPYFILENVSSILYLNRGRHFQAIISALAQLDYKIEWKTVNAVDFNIPQNRERVIIIGSLQTDMGAVYLMDEMEEKFLTENDRLHICDYAVWRDIPSAKDKFQNWGTAYKGKFCSIDISKPRKYGTKLTEILQDCVDDNFDFTEDTLKRIENSQYVDKYLNGVHILYNQGGGARMGYTVFGVDGVAPTLTATTSRHYERYKIGDRYRRLTNVEYARLQGFPDDHCKQVSTYAQYRLYGNALPPIFAKWALDLILDGKRRIINKPITLFDFAEVRYG